MTSITDQTKKDTARARIARLHRDFISFGNPMSAFNAYLEARSIGDPLPAWVQNYIDEGVRHFVNALREFNRTPPDRRAPLNHPDKAFAEAFGIKAGHKNARSGRSGRGTIWSRYIETRWVAIGSEASWAAWRRHEAGKPVNETGIVAEAAAIEGVSFKTAMRDWAKWKSTEVFHAQRIKELCKKAGSPKKSPTF